MMNRTRAHRRTANCRVEADRGFKLPLMQVQLDARAPALGVYLEAVGQPFTCANTFATSPRSRMRTHHLDLVRTMPNRLFHTTQ